MGLGCVGELSAKITSGHWPLSGQQSSALSFRVHLETRFDLKSIFLDLFIS